MLSDQELEYKHFEEISSTNDFLRNYEPLVPVTVAVAEFQTKGRGQVGNTWVSDRGRNLLFSLLLCPTQLRAGNGFILSQAMALAIKDTLDKYIPDVMVKWPNDIYCRGHKICGTLIENTLCGAMVSRSVIGSGININQTEFPDGLAAPATSLRLLLGHDTPVKEILDDVIENFLSYYDEIQRGEYDRIRQTYHQVMYMRGRECTFKDNGGIFRGTISHVENSGHLIIVDTDKKERRYAFKEVKMLVKDAPTGDDKQG